MTSYKNNHPSSAKSNNSRVWAGVIILGIGLLLLAGQLNLGHLIPSWVRSWQIILIVVGLAIGGSSSFKNPASFILIGLGTIFLLQKYFYFNIWKLFFPVAIIVVGLWLLMDKKRHNIPPYCGGGGNGGGGGSRSEEDLNVDYTKMDENEYGSNADYQGEDNGDESYQKSKNKGTYSAEDYLNSTAIFSEEKKIITSRNLQGGEVVNIFGGTDINLIQADIQGPIVIDIFQLFAGTKIIVPANWKVHSKVVSIFGEVDDRRFFQESVKDDKKIIYLKGTSIFGGVTIKSM